MSGAFREWGVSYHDGDILEIQAVDWANSRVGGCWAHGRLRKGDRIVCVGHAGDHFHRFRLLKHHKAYRQRDGKNALAVELEDVPEFGAYGGVGEKVGKITGPAYHRLLGNGFEWADSMEKPQGQETP